MDNTEDRKGFIAKGSEWVLERAPGGRALLLRGGRAGAARGAAAAAFAPDLPGQARRLPPEDGPHPGPRRGDRAADRARGPRRVGAHGRAALQGGPEHARRQGIHGPAGHHGRHLRPPRAVPGQRVEGDLRPVPAGLRRRTTRRGKPRARSSRWPTASTRSAGSSGSGSFRRDRRIRTACAARPSGPSRSRSRATGARTGGRSRARRCRCCRRTSRARTTSRPWRSSAASSPSGCAACSSAAGTRTTRSRPS